MKKRLLYFIFIIIAVSLALSCKKGLVRQTNVALPAGSGPGVSILVDASRDGGAWWAPQGFPFDATKPHKGSALVHYLKQSGYSVKELEPGTGITKELLKQYKFVIRAVGDGAYSVAEIEAYRSFLTSHTSLLLFNDHQKNYPNDQLSALLGLQFEGAHTGTITTFNQHVITGGVSSLEYMDGSVILQPDLNAITPLAFFSNATVKNATVMGIVHHNSCRIVFVGDLDGIELLPQPLTDNLVRWLF
jgi:hypothetical protein